MQGTSFAADKPCWTEPPTGRTLAIRQCKVSRTGGATPAGRCDCIWGSHATRLIDRVAAPPTRSARIEPHLAPSSMPAQVAPGAPTPAAVHLRGPTPDASRRPPAGQLWRCHQRASRGDLFTHHPPAPAQAMRAMPDLLSHHAAHEVLGQLPRDRVGRWHAQQLPGLRQPMGLGAWRDPPQVPNDSLRRFASFFHPPPRKPHQIPMPRIRMHHQLPRIR